jgi:hypothetical protein
MRQSGTRRCEASNERESAVVDRRGVVFKRCGCREPRSRQRLEAGVRGCPSVGTGRPTRHSREINSPQRTNIDSKRSAQRVRRQGLEPEPADPGAACLPWSTGMARAVACCLHRDARRSLCATSVTRNAGWEPCGGASRTTSLSNQQSTGTCGGIAAGNVFDGLSWLVITSGLECGR